MTENKKNSSLTNSSITGGDTGEKLHASEAYFRQIWEASADAMALSDPDGIVLDVNPAYLRLYGYDLTQVIGQSFAIIFPEEVRAWAVEEYKAVFASKDAPAPIESIVRHADGSERIVESVATFLTTGEKRTAMLSTIRDITERRGVERESRRSQERLRLIMESITEYAIMTTDLEGYVTSWNVGAEETFGFTAAEILGQDTAIIFTPEDRARGVPAQEREQARRTGRAMDERWHLRKGGERFYVSGVMSPLQDGNITIGYVKVARDLTEQKKVDEALRQSEERYRTLFKSIDEGFCVIDVLFDEAGQPFDYRFLEVNPAFERQTGLEQAVGKTMRELAPDHEADWFEIYGRVAQTGEPMRFELRAAALQRWYDVYAFCVEQPEGRRVGILFNDITHRKQTEEALRRLNETLEFRVQERTEQVRHLAAELTLSEQAERRRISQILHDDLQQRLYSLNFYLTNLRHALDDGRQEIVQRTLAEINAIVEESIQATRSLSVDLSPPILHYQGFVEALHWLAGQMAQQHGLVVSVEAADAIWLPDEDLRVLLFQIVRELLFNIVKHAGVNSARVGLTFENHQICIEVRDEGRGFDVNAQNEQNSQGLLRIQQRLQLMGGTLQIETGAGQGTCVTLYSPLREGNG